MVSVICGWRVPQLGLHPCVLGTALTLCSSSGASFTYFPCHWKYYMAGFQNAHLACINSAWYVLEKLRSVLRYAGNCYFITRLSPMSLSHKMSPVYWCGLHCDNLLCSSCCLMFKKRGGCWVGKSLSERRDPGSNLTPASRVREPCRSETRLVLFVIGI